MEGLRWLITALMHWSLLVRQTEGGNCESIQGSWYNEVGDKIVLKEADDGKIQGDFYGEQPMSSPDVITHSPVYGYQPFKKAGDVFAFTTSFMKGASTKSWTCQCEVCSDGKEMLVMSWLLRTNVDTCRDKWKSTMIGKDIFTRNKSADKTTTNVDNSTQIRSPDSAGKDNCSDITGIWYNDVGSEVILKEDAAGVISGEYRTAVEREEGSAGSTHSNVFGYQQVNGSNSTLSLSVVWRNGGSVTTFVGQCHVCSEGSDPVLETSWILQAKVGRCEDNWKSTTFGHNTFTRHEQKEGPRKAKGTHVPERDGEPPDNTCAGEAMVGCGWLSILALLTVHFVCSVWNSWM